jgi:zinc protease
LVGRLPLSLETNAGTASALLNLERYQRDLDYIRQLPGKFAAITREDILRVAQTYWQLDNLVIASAGVALS